MGRSWTGASVSDGAPWPERLHRRCSGGPAGPPRGRPAAEHPAAACVIEYRNRRQQRRGGRPIKPFRSLLYAPGDRPDAIEAAAASAADGLILDLEDRVPGDRKDEARSIVRAAVGRLGADRVIYVRVNPPDSGRLREDLEAVTVGGLEGVRVPKVESPADVRRVDALLSEVEQANGVAVGATRLSLGLESASAVRLAYELCSASDRVSSVAAGLGRGGDLQTDVAYVPGDDGSETLYIRSKVVLDARAAGVPIPLDGAFGRYGGFDPATEEAAFLRSAEMGRRLGYRAKICFHASQAEAINRIFGEVEAR